jgi:ubiquitin carboxyl-terminal hydrolase 10
LPWFSSPELEWPTRRQRRKRKTAAQLSEEPVELPSIAGGNTNTEVGSALEEPTIEEQNIEDEAAPRPETPSTNHAPSEEISTNPTTPSSQQQTLSIAGDTTPVAPKPLPKTAIPAVPVIPALPKSLPRELSKTSPELNKAQSSAFARETIALPVETQAPAFGDAVLQDSVVDGRKEGVTALPAWSRPKVWSGLFNSSQTSAPPIIEAHRGSVALDSTKPTTNSLADILKSFSATSNDSKIPFIEPRGLVNSGNMCYMNSVLQVLIFCVPFYTFLDKVKKGAVHRFNSETPILDSM